MSTGVAGFSRHNHLSELNDPLVTNEGVKTPAQRRQLVLGNLGITATFAEVNAATDVSGRLVSISDADTTILAANSGKPHVIANVSADRTFTLPTPTSGLEFPFYAGAIVADGHDWIFSLGALVTSGGLIHGDTDANAAGDELVPIRPNGSTHNTLQVNVPDVGTYLKFIGDGTGWIVTGIVYSATAPAFSAV